MLEHHCSLNARRCFALRLDCMLVADNLELQQQPLKTRKTPSVGLTTTTTTCNSNSITRLEEKNYWDRNKNREISQSLGNRRLEAADGENGERLLQSSECCLMLSGIGGSWTGYCLFVCLSVWKECDFADRYRN